MSAPFPFAAAIAFGLGTLRMEPTAFWRTTPRELLALAAPPDGARPPGRAALDALLERYPDPGDRP